MKKALALAILATLIVAPAARASDDSKAQKSAAAAEKVVSGTLARVDMNYRAISVADSKGVNWQIVWTDATKIMGGELKEGVSVQVGYVEAENRNWATWIKVQEAGK